MKRLLLLASSAAVLSGCGGGTDPASQPTSSETRDEPTTERETTTAAGTTTEDAPPRAPPAEAPPGIPGFVAGYRDWTRLNDGPIPPRPSDPHNGTKNVYASKERRPSGRFPAGTIVVKEATRPGTDFIGLIAVMRKERGADPAHGDWVFVEHTRDARKQRFREAGSGAVCWTCHLGARDSDYVFTE